LIGFRSDFMYVYRMYGTVRCVILQILCYR